MDAYTPVSCDFHDELEAIATLHQTCQIVYRTEENARSKISGKIVDVYASNHADYVKLGDGTVIRLDQIVSVNDKPVSFSCD
uniref:Rho-binding antiterminator n=1 Tax=Oscillatoriales cyanobacterium SpSt-402 TaxID=2282168 RepID=A0A832M4Z6_9CYAN